jgi:VWFA-related protein
VKSPAIAILLTVAAVLPLPAQQQTPLVESIEVQIVNIDVVVTDKSGKPVTGLTANDFEVLEDGKRQPITNFYEARATAAAPATATASSPEPEESRPRHFILFVDNYTLHPHVRTEVVASLDQFIDKHLGSHDEASIASWNRSLQILTPFTSDKAALHAAVAKVATIGSVNSLATPLGRAQQSCMRSYQAMRNNRMTPRLAYEECIMAVTDQTEELALGTRQLMGAINVTLNMLAGFEGRKILVLAGAQLPSRPGLEIFQWANQTFQPFLRGFDAALSSPGIEISKVQGLAMDALAQTANAQGATLYIIAAAMPGDPIAIATGVATDDNGADFQHRMNTAGASRTLAEATGGVAVARTSKLDAVFDNIAHDLESYYSLGFKPAEGRGSKPREITVRTKNRDHVVRARKTWTPKTSDDQFADRVIANIYSPATKSDFEVTIKAAKATKHGNTFTVPIEVTFPPSLTLLPQDETLVGGFTFAVAVGNSLGGLSTVFRQPQSISIERAEEQGFRQTPITYTASLTVGPGESLISVGILDQVGKTAGFARATIVSGQ